MNTNGVSMEVEDTKTQDNLQAPDQEEDEIQIISDGSNPYKKVKLNMESAKKKRTTEVVEISSGGEEGGEAGGAQKKVKEPKSPKDEGKEEKKKKKSKKKKERENEDDEAKQARKKEKEEKKKRKKKAKEAGGEEELDVERFIKDVERMQGAEEDEVKIKKKKKDKSKDKEKEKNGDEKKDKEKKKKKKKEEKEKEKQKDPNQEEKDKKKKKRQKEQKEAEAREKKMAEFERKYPKYIQKGKIKFPIDDVLFRLYDIILGEHLPKTKKPMAKNGLISAVELGDILQIWNFLTSFPELFSFGAIQQEEIYACLKYDKEEHLSLIDNIHKEILFLFVREFLKKNKFETYRDEVEKPFLLLIKYYVGYERPLADELLLVWTELAKNISVLSPYGDNLNHTAKRFFEMLAEKNTRNYNKLEYKVKVRVLIELINMAYDTEIFRDCLQEKMDQVTGLTKEKNELLQEIKTEELEYYDLKAKVELAEKQQKEDEEKREQMSRVELMKRQKEIENEKREYEKALAALSKVESSKERKTQRVEEISGLLTGNVETAFMLGQDANKSQYWIFQGKPDRLYMKVSPNITTEDTWMFYDKKAELDQLQESLNSKGIMEKSLLEKIKEAISSGHLALRDDEASDEKKAENEDLGYWTEKVLGYVPGMELEEEETEVKRTTRSQGLPEPEKEKTNTARPKELHYLTIDGIKELLNKMDETLSGYLNKWNARWGTVKAKEELRRKIVQAEDPKELALLLLEVEKNFQFSETPLKPKTQGGADEMEMEEDEDDDEEDDEEEDEEEEEEEKDEERSAVEDSDGERCYESDEPKIKKKGGRKDSRQERDEYDDDSHRIKKKNKKEEKKMEIEDDEDEPRLIKKSGKSRRKFLNDDEEEEEQKIAESDVEKKSEADKIEEEAPVTAGNEKTMEIEEPQEEKKIGEEEKPAGEGEGTQEPQEKVKRSALKIWGKAMDRVRRCWTEYIKHIDNVVGLYLATTIFGELVEIYVAKKNERYFKDYKSGAEYSAARRNKKQAALTRASEKRQEQTQKQRLDKLNKQRENRAVSRHTGHPAPQPAVKETQKFVHQDSLDGYRIKKRGQVNKEEEKQNGGEEAKKAKKVRMIDSEESESEESDEYQKPSDRSKGKDKLAEITNVRRSTRTSRYNRRAELAEESEEEKECADCGGTGNNDEIVNCTICDSSHHLNCVDLDAMPDDKWTCINCWQKLSSTRHTRSTTRKLH